MTMRRHSSWLRLAFSRDRSGDARTGSADRFTLMVLPHLDGAWRYARFLCRDDNVAEDVVQEAFVRALKAIDQCCGDPRAWLFAILRNCHHDWTRANARMPLSEMDDESPELMASDDPHHHAEISDLRQLIEGLPEPFREALILRELEELTYRDIAEVTGAPIGTVMSRLARARQMLGALLRDVDPTLLQRGQA